MQSAAQSPPRCFSCPEEPPPSLQFPGSASGGIGAGGWAAAAAAALDCNVLPAAVVSAAAEAAAAALKEPCRAGRRTSPSASKPSRREVSERRGRRAEPSGAPRQGRAGLSRTPFSRRPPAPPQVLSALRRALLLLQEAEKRGGEAGCQQTGECLGKGSYGLLKQEGAPLSLSRVNFSLPRRLVSPCLVPCFLRGGEKRVLLETNALSGLASLSIPWISLRNVRTWQSLSLCWGMDGGL